MLIKFIPFIIASVLLNAFAQLFIRKGMLTLGALPTSIAEGLSYAWNLCLNIYIVAGMSSYAISIVLWMYVLAKVNVSIAYPFQSVGYIVAAFIAFFTLGEPFSIQKIVGIIVICVGVFILSSSPEAMK